MSDIRKKDAPTSFGRMAIKIISERLPDPEPYDALTVNAAHDGQLADALACRGYDVTLKTPSPATIERRKREHEGRKARRSP